jgi:hypothetical protein
MNKLDGRKLDELYKKYGFTIKSITDNLRVYTFRQGYFHAAEIVPLAEGAPTPKAEKEYKDSGYAVRTRNFHSIHEAEQALFDGFFSTDETSTRLVAYYNTFHTHQTKTLGGAYHYIPCPFTTANSTQEKEDISITDYIIKSISQSGPQLVLIEAAAGYGKTCTAYEVVNAMATQQPPITPIFTELSRNRRARVFHYVLLDEIDRNYQGLNSELVKSQILAGRLPLVIDGFDELLQKNTALPEKDDSFEDIESMLDTIGALLKGEAKVILTTRRTAIFAGDDFHRWMSSRENDFTLTRISIEEPSVQNWLGPERYELIEKSSIPIKQIANPVLLTFLRNLADEDFLNCCTDPELVISKYFTSLLEREQKRQELRISWQAQLLIFKSLAKEMADFDITSEKKAFIKDLIANENAHILEEVRKTYPPTERPTIDELADTLAGHALLDRVGRNDDTVGFMNDFVFGTLIGDTILESNKDDWVASEHMLNLAVTAYRMRSTDRRKTLRTKLDFACQLLDLQTQLSIDLDLCDRPLRNFTDATFDTLTVSNVSFPPDTTFVNCTFSHCVFHNVDFHVDAFKSVGFLNCTFYNCRATTSSSSSSDATGCWALGCQEYSGSVIAAFQASPSVSVRREIDPHDEYEKNILRQFWPIGRPHAQRHRAVRTLFLGFAPSAHTEVHRAIDSLRRQGLITINGEQAILDTEKMATIRELLGRTGD